MISNKSNKNLIREILEDFATTGIFQLRDFLERLFNQLMLTEREDYVQAGLYERTPEYRAYCNGFKDKKLIARAGVLNLEIPQVREGNFYPSCLGKGEKNEGYFYKFVKWRGKIWITRK